jgi:hypothetical protein
LDSGSINISVLVFRKMCFGKFRWYCDFKSFIIKYWVMRKPEKIPNIVYQNSIWVIGLIDLYIDIVRENCWVEMFFFQGIKRLTSIPHTFIFCKGVTFVSLSYGFLFRFLSKESIFSLPLFFLINIVLWAGRSIERERKG